MPSPSTTAVTDDPLLQRYLTTHLTGAAAAIELLANAAERLDADDLRDVVEEIREDRETVRQLMATMDLSPSTLAQRGSWALERASRLARRALHLRSADLRHLAELEAMLTGVHGKLALWRLLGDLRDAHPALAELPVEELLARGRRHADVVDRHRRAAGRRALTRAPRPT